MSSLATMKGQMEFVGPPDLVNKAGTRVGNREYSAGGLRFKMIHNADGGVQYKRQ